MVESFIEGAVSVSEQALAIFGVIGVLWVVIKKIYKMARNVERIVELTEKNTVAIAAMDKELKTNGGSSIKDAVTRIEKAQAELQVRFDRHLGA